jgi:hypothetical protein
MMRSTLHKAARAVVLGGLALSAAAVLAPAPVRAQVASTQSSTLEVTSGSTGGVNPLARTFTFNPQVSTFQIAVPAGWVLDLTGVSGNWVTGNSNITPFLAVGFHDSVGNPGEIDLFMSANQLKPVTFDISGVLTSYTFNNLLNVPIDGGCTDGQIVTFSAQTTLGAAKSIVSARITAVGAFVPRACP